MDLNPISLRVIETVTTKLDGTQHADVTVIDAETSRPIQGLAGVTTQTTGQGRSLILQISSFGHEVREKKEVVAVQDGGAPSDQ